MRTSAWISVLVFAALAPTVHADTLKAIHINVGQGDATLILGPADSSGDRVAVLMDAGDITFQGDPDGGVLVRSVLEREGISHIDFFIASHYDADHIGGVIAGLPHVHGSSFILGADGVPGGPGDDDGDGVADWIDSSMQQPDPEEIGTGDDITVGTFVDRGDSGHPNTATYDKYFGMASALGTRRSITSQSDVDTFEIDLGGGAVMVLLSGNGLVRDRSSAVDDVNTENERSLCFLLRFGGFDYLLGGDTIGRNSGNEDARVEGEIGEFIQANGISIDVLHVNHHGADNASDSDFLTAIQPEVAIISAGNENEHHHPTLNALERLAAANVNFIVQTNWGTTRDMRPLLTTIPPEVRLRQAIYQSDIVLLTDGSSFEISTVRRFLTDD